MRWQCFRLENLHVQIYDFPSLNDSILGSCARTWMDDHVAECLCVRCASIPPTPCVSILVSCRTYARCGYGTTASQQLASLPCETSWTPVYHASCTWMYLATYVAESSHALTTRTEEQALQRRLKKSSQLLYVGIRSELCASPASIPCKRTVHWL
jgi:hypothetical protein